MLAAAEQLRAFSRARLSQGQRLGAKVALREELAAQRLRRPPAAFPLRLAWPQWRLAPLAALLAVVLFSTVAFSAVAASQPGDFAYPVRVAVERAPVLLQASADGRTAAELALADRRLDDVRRAGEAHPVALDALLRSDAAAVEGAAALAEAERAAVAARVAYHAEELKRLAEQNSDPDTSSALLLAAGEAEAISERLTVVVAAPPGEPTASALLVETGTPTPTPAPSNTPLPVVVPALSMTPPPAQDLPTPILPTIPPIPTVGTLVVPPPQVTPLPSLTWAPATVIVPTVKVPATVIVPTVKVPTVIIPTVKVPTVIIPTVKVPTVIIPTVRSRRFHRSRPGS
jgi:hypothetical protein